MADAVRYRTWCMMAAAAAFLLPAAPAHAYIGCATGIFTFRPDGINAVLGHAHAGQPCEIWFGNYAALNDHTLSGPAHGTAVWNQSSMTRNFVVYTPHPSFTGNDYFQYNVAYQPDRRGRRTHVLIRVNMTVTK